MATVAMTETATSWYTQDEKYSTEISNLTGEPVMQLDSAVSALRDIFNSVQILLGVMIVFANTVILWLFTRYDLLKAKPNIFLFSLSLGDMLCGVSSVHTGVANFFRYSPRAEIPCVLSGILQTMTCGMSLICMAGVAGANYVKIAHPYVHARYEESHIHLILAICSWLYMAVFGGMMAYKHQWSPGKDCYLLQIADKTLYMYTIPPMEVVLLLFITVVFIRILVIARRHRRQLAGSLVRSQVQSVSIPTSTQVQSTSANMSSQVQSNSTNISSQVQSNSGTILSQVQSSSATISGQVQKDTGPIANRVQRKHTNALSQVGTRHPSAATLHISPNHCPARQDSPHPRQSPLPCTSVRIAFSSAAGRSVDGRSSDGSARFHHDASLPDSIHEAPSPSSPTPSFHSSGVSDNRGRSAAPRIAPSSDFSQALQDDTEPRAMSAHGLLAVRINPHANPTQAGLQKQASKESNDSISSTIREAFMKSDSLKQAYVENEQLSDPSISRVPAARPCPEPTKDPEEQRAEKRSERGTNLVITLVIVLYVCWTPLLVQVGVRSALATKPTSMAWVAFSELANIILFSNSFLNPFFIQQFSPQMKKAFNACFHRNVVQPF